MHIQLFQTAEQLLFWALMVDPIGECRVQAQKALDRVRCGSSHFSTMGKLETLMNEGSGHCMLDLCMVRLEV